MNIEAVETLARSFEGQSVENILKWSFDKFGNKLGFMTALGSSGIVLLDHLRKLKPDIEAHFIDTGFHFQETLALLNRLRSLWNITFKVLKPRMDLKELKNCVGQKPWEINPDLCCHYMKVEPLLRIIHKKKAWLSALRRDQSVTRGQLDVVEIDGRGIVKIYPLIDKTYDQIWEYIRENNLPYNTLHDKGYPSVGCIYCTTPVEPGEHERSGRWNSIPKLECGIHLHHIKKRKKY